MHAYNGVLTILGLACFLYLLFCASVKVKRTVPLLCVCVHFAWKGRPRNDLYCVGWDSLTDAALRGNRALFGVPRRRRRLVGKPYY